MTTSQANGELAIQTLAMPANTNANGDIFGGWLVSQMDLAGGVLAKKTAHSRITTVAIDSMVFYQPVHVGDVVSCYGKLIKIGRTSMTINIEAWVSAWDQVKQELVTSGCFTYVAIDQQGRPQPVERKK